MYHGLLAYTLALLLYSFNTPYDCRFVCSPLTVILTREILLTGTKDHLFLASSLLLDILTSRRFYQALGYGGWEAGVGKDWKLNALWLVGEKLPDHSCGSKGGEGRETE
jgi:hypothetical protein